MCFLDVLSQYAFSVFSYVFSLCADEKQYGIIMENKRKRLKEKLDEKCGLRARNYS